MNQKDLHLKLLHQTHLILTLKTQRSSSDGNFRILRVCNFLRGYAIFYDRAISRPRKRPRRSCVGDRGLSIIVNISDHKRIQC